MPPPQLELPVGWAAYEDDAGRTYYHHARLGVTQWEAPKATQPSPPRLLGQGSGLGRAVRASHPALQPSSSSHSPPHLVVVPGGSTFPSPSRSGGRGLEGSRPRPRPACGPGG